MEADAVAYDKLSISQVEEGAKFINELSLAKGDKVLDMGCGTGILTKYIADIVGPDGKVVGVDPDAARIKIAVEKYKESGNLHFHVSDSVAGFPNDDQPYYDAHVSTYVFHWIPNDQKMIYIRKAYECLKSGGRLAIGEAIKKTFEVKKIIPDLYSLTPEGYRDLFQAVGLFKNVAMDGSCTVSRFQTFDDLKRWFRASSHQNFEDIDPVYVDEHLTRENDGRITWITPTVIIKARKD